jgi:ribosome-associated protein
MNLRVKEFFPETLKVCHRIAVDKKCGDLRVFAMGAEWGLADYVILATATAEPHLRALGEELCQVFKHHYGWTYRMDYTPLSGWIAFDAFSVIVHALTAAMRREYRLDQLFESSTILDLGDDLSIDIRERSTMKGN